MSIIVSILSEWNGKALKTAQNQVGLFDRQLKKLAVTLGSAFSVRKIVQFSKASVKAFVEEDKAIRALSQNLSNLSLAYDVAPIERYIRELQYATGVADGELRPAFQQLVQATRSVTESQDLLGLALDVSAGTGKSLSQVTQGLTRAFLGNTTSLGRLNLGLTKGELKTKKFDDIVKDLSVRFSGQASRAAGTYAGKLAILSAAGQDAQEVLGQKLLTSVEMLMGKDMGVKGLATTFNNMATDVGNLAIGLADVIKQLGKLTGVSLGGISVKNMLQAIPVVGSYLVLLLEHGTELASRMNLENQTALGHQKDLARLATQVYKVTKGTVQELTKKQKLELASKALAKSGDLMDLDKIQLAAASQGKITDQEKLRIEYMQKRLDLEDAIASKEANRALALANQLTTLEEKITSFKPSSPFDTWEDAILRMQNGLYNLGISEKSLGQGKTSPNLSAPPEFPNMSVFAPGGFLSAENIGRQMNKTEINVNVQGSGGLDEQTKRAVVDAVVEASSGGIATNWFRTTGRAVATL